MTISSMRYCFYKKVTFSQGQTYTSKCSQSHNLNDTMNKYTKKIG